MAFTPFSPRQPAASARLPLTLITLDDWALATLTGAENQKAVQFAWDRTILLCLYDEICMVVGAWDKRIPPHFILHRTRD